MNLYNPEFITHRPGWSAPQLRIIDSEDSERVVERVNALLADDDMHICAVSPTTIGAGWMAYRYSDGGEPTPHFAVTVLVQERIDPNQGNGGVE